MGLHPWPLAGWEVVNRPAPGLCPHHGHIGCGPFVAALPMSINVVPLGMSRLPASGAKPCVPSAPSRLSAGAARTSRGLWTSRALATMTPFLTMSWMTSTRGQAQAVSTSPFPFPAHEQWPIQSAEGREHADSFSHGSGRRSCRGTRGPQAREGPAVPPGAEPGP